LQGLRLAGDIIYRGTFATGLFQCLYQPGPAHWAMLPATLEWHLGAAAALLAALVWPPAALVAAAMLGLSFLVAGLQGAQAQFPGRHRGWRARLLVAVLSYLQPLVRSWARYRTRLLAYRPPQADPDHLARHGQRLPLWGRRTAAYWSEEGYERTELLGLLIAYLNERGWGKTVDGGWSDWDVEVHCHPWTVVRLSTAQEEHGGGKRLIRVRYRLRLAGSTKGLVAAAAALGLGALAGMSWPLAAAAGAVLGVVGLLWWRGTVRASQATAVVDALASSLGLIPCTPETQEAGETRSPEPAVRPGYCAADDDTSLPAAHTVVVNGPDLSLPKGLSLRMRQRPDLS
jgi:hypothetical protein